MLSITRLSVFALLLTSSALANHDNTLLRQKRGLGSKRHSEIAERQVKEVGELVQRDEEHNNTLAKRAFTGRGTFYYTGLGACGELLNLL